MWRTLGTFCLRGGPDGDQRVKARIARIASRLGLPARLLGQIEAAMARATANAPRPGSLPGADLPVEVRVLISETLRAPGKGGIDLAGSAKGKAVHPANLRPDSSVGPDPNADPKPAAPGPASQPSAQGWGFFLVDQPGGSAGDRHRVDLFLYPEGDQIGPLATGR